MKIAGLKRIMDAKKTHPNCAKKLDALVKILEVRDYGNLNQVKEDFSALSILKDNRVVFNIHGNDFRVVAKIDFNTKGVLILFADTHAEYDKIDANKVN